MRIKASITTGLLRTLAFFLVIRSLWFFAAFHKHVQYSLDYFLSTAIEIFLLYLIFIVLRLNQGRGRMVFAGLFSVAIVGLYSGDLFYFFEANKHIGFEILILSDPIALFFINHGLKENILALTILGFSMGLFFYLIRFLSLARLPHGKLCVFGCLLVLLCFFSRGKTLFLHNPFYSIAASLSEVTLPAYKRKEPAKNLKTVRTLISYPGARFIDTQYPLLRESLPAHKEIRKNVILIVLESWTAKYTLRSFLEGSPTPHFNRLAGQGVNFSRAFAVGNRTANGLVSILLGIPDLPGKSLLKTNLAFRNFTPLPVIFKDRGYETIFLSNGKLQFESILPRLKPWGFRRVINRTNLAPNARQVGDEILYKHILRAAKQADDAPFFIMAHTADSHYPYKLPPGARPVFPEGFKDSAYLNSLAHADAMLGSFMKQAKQETFYENTLFIFLSDHTFHRNLNLYEDRRIPFALFAPGFLSPREVQTITSQIDLMPLLLRLLGISTRFASMGKDPLSPGKSFTYFGFGGIYGSLTGSDIYYNRLKDSGSGKLFPTNPFSQKNNLCSLALNSFLCERRENTTLSYLDLYSRLLEDNQLTPAH